MIRNYFKIAFRNLWRSRWFSLINITGLGIGLTAGFLIFLYVNFQLSYDDFHSKGDRIYRVVTDLKTPSEVLRIDIPAMAVPPNLEKEFPEIESAVRVASYEMLVRKDNLKFSESNVIDADSSFFKIFDFKLLQGDPTTVLKDPFSLVISESTAKKYFGTANPVGKTLEIMDAGHTATVTGVMEDIPTNSHIKADIVVSFTTVSQRLDPTVDEQWSGYGAAGYILLKPGTDPARLEAKFPDFLERMNGEQMRQNQMYPTLFLENFEKVYLYSDRGSTGSGGDIRQLYVFSLIALFIILIACINFINLTTARSIERAKEVGIRKVVGAQKQQLALQFLGESVILCLLAFVITIGLSALLLPYFNTLAGETVLEGIFTAPSYLLLLFGVSFTIGLLAGIYPALVLSSFQPIQVLKGRFSGGDKGILLRKGLVVSQFTISIALIIGTLVVYNQMVFMRSQNLGFNKEQVLVLQTNGNSSQYAFQQEINKYPGVLSSSFGSSIPGGGNAGAYSEIENKQGDFQIANLPVYFVDFDYIPQFEMELVAGRAFSRDFATDSTQAMIINEKAAKLFGYNTPEEALGRNFRQWGREGEIVGVVKDFHFTSLQKEIEPLSIRMESNRNSRLIVKLDGQNISGTIAAIEKSWNKLLPQQPFDYIFLDEFFDSQYRAEERFGKLFLNFAILAILISCLGLLGLASYSTLQRRREIGIRKVIGSSVTGIVNLLSKDFLILVGIAFIIASPLAWLGMHYWLQDFAYRVDIEWWVFLVAGISAMLIALLTVSFQAIKAAIANPVKSLRTE